MFVAAVLAAVVGATVGSGPAWAADVPDTHPDLHVELSTPSPDVHPGVTFTYTATVVNGHGDETTPLAAGLGVELFLDVPAGAALVGVPAGGPDWTCAAPDAGTTEARCTTTTVGGGTTAPPVTVTLELPADAGSGSITAGARVAATNELGEDAEDNTDDITFTVHEVPDLAISMPAAGEAVVPGDGLVEHVVTVTNDGYDDLADVSVDVDLSGGTYDMTSEPDAPWSCVTNAGPDLRCTIDTLPSDSSDEVTFFVAAVDDGVTTAVLTTATLDLAGRPNRDATNDSAAMSTPITPLADIAIALTADDAVVAGEAITYVATASNAGPSTARDVVVALPLPATTTFVSVDADDDWTCTPPAEDDPPGSLLCTGDDLADGEQSIFELVVSSDQASGGTTVDAAATIASTTPQPDGGDDDDVASVETTVRTPGPDLAVSITGPAVAAAGADTPYEVTVDNAGFAPADAAIVNIDAGPHGTITSIAGDGWTCAVADAPSTATCERGSVASDDVVPSIELEVSVPADFGQDLGAQTVDVAVAPADSDDDTSDNTDTAETTFLRSSDLSLTVTAPATVAPGADLTYDVTVTNNGPSDALDVVVVTLVPEHAVLRSITASDPSIECGSGHDPQLDAVVAGCIDEVLAAGDSFTATVTVTLGSYVDGDTVDAPFATVAFGNHLDDPELDDNAVDVHTVVTGPPTTTTSTTSTTAPPTGGTSGGGSGAPAPSPTTTTTTTTTPPRPDDDDAAVDEPGSGGAAVGDAADAASGYWMLGEDGAVYAFGDAEHVGNAPVTTGVDLEPTPSGRGYWVVDSLGGVHARGDAPFLGANPALFGDERVTSISSTASGRGYWLFTTAGRAFAFGDAPVLGDLTGIALNAPVLDSITTPTGRGYYLVAGDGGIFTFGDAVFHGSMGATPLNAPVQSLVPDPDGTGYWLVAADGGVFSFAAAFRGSMGGTTLNAPVTGMVAFGDGYLMVGADGGVFTFSNRRFDGSLGANPPARPIVSVAALD